MQCVFNSYGELFPEARSLLKNKGAVTVRILHTEVRLKQRDLPPSAHSGGNLA